MKLIELVKKIGRNDLKLIGRDSFLIMTLTFILIISVVLRILLPELDVLLFEKGILPNESVHIRLADIYPMIVAYMALFSGSVIVGTIIGFLIIDEKDQQTLKATMVTPLSINQYVLYRVGFPVVFAFIVIFIMCLIINQALPDLWKLIVLCIGASLTSSIIALFYGLVAKNKVQGFAYSKFISISGWSIMIGWFISEPYQWLMALFPPFLISKAYWMVLNNDNLWISVLISGIVTQLLLVKILTVRFNNIIYH